MTIDEYFCKVALEQKLNLLIFGPMKELYARREVVGAEALVTD